MKNEQLYRKAIETAAYQEEIFRKARADNGSIKEELRQMHRRMFVEPAAHGACAQQDLIAQLFGVSEEKVHEDISKVIEKRKEVEL